jgi:hypothetical protein
MARPAGGTKLEVSATERARSETAALRLFDVLHTAVESGHLADLGLPLVDSQNAQALRDAIPVLLKSVGCQLPTGHQHNGTASTCCDKVTFNTKNWNGVNLPALQFQLVQLLGKLPQGGRVRRCRDAIAKAPGARKVVKLLHTTACTAGCNTEHKSLAELKADILTIAEECAEGCNQLAGLDSAARRASKWLEACIGRAQKLMVCNCFST